MAIVEEHSRERLALATIEALRFQNPGCSTAL
jgi:hypothetical protein